MSTLRTEYLRLGNIKGPNILTNRVKSQLFSQILFNFEVFASVLCIIT